MLIEFLPALPFALALEYVAVFSNPYDDNDDNYENNVSIIFY